LQPAKKIIVRTKIIVAVFFISLMHEFFTTLITAFHIFSATGVKTKFFEMIHSFRIIVN